MTGTGFLAEFPAVSTQEWEDVIRKDLKGADYDRKLVWQTGEGFSVKPYYRAEEVSDLEQLNAAPGDFPYMRGTRSTPGWNIREEIVAVDPAEANRAALSVLAAGADEIALCGVRIANDSDLAMLLVNLENVPLHFHNADEAVLRLLAGRLSSRQHGATISTGWEPSANPEFAAKILASSPSAFVPFAIYGDTFEQAGATSSEEIGLSLATAIDFMAEMQQHGLQVNQIANSIAFSFAIGSTFFMQIAKLRAIRMLWARVVESFGGTRDVARARIHARTSHWNETIYDPHVNILRATSEAMAAVLGGANSITVAPFDECYRSPDAASRRIARNTQLILRHEAHFARVADPGGGSYFLESLTDSLARRGWELMQEVERAGGYRRARESGLIAQRLETSRIAREQAIATRRSILTGTNRFANPAEQALGRIDEALISDSPRGARPYEQLRLRTERHANSNGKMPHILLAQIGDPKMRSARSQFSSDVFASAGLATVTQRFFVADQIATCDADLIVLCSSDDEYLKHASDLFAAFAQTGRETPVVIAGNPETAEELRALGVSDFVHLRGNPVEFLTCWQKRLEIED
jgi:methylmalonyl-CoA mutase